MATVVLDEIVNDLKMRMDLANTILKELDKLPDTENGKASAVAHYLGQKNELQKLLDNPMSAASIDRYTRIVRSSTSTVDEKGNITIGLKPASLHARSGK